MPYKKNKEGESLAEKNPDLITEWNAEKNVGLEITKGNSLSDKIANQRI